MSTAVHVRQKLDDQWPNARGPGVKIHSIAGLHDCMNDCMGKTKGSERCVVYDYFANEQIQIKPDVVLKNILLSSILSQSREEMPFPNIHVFLLSTFLKYYICINQRLESPLKVSMHWCRQEIPEKSFSQFGQDMPIHFCQYAKFLFHFLKLNYG